MRQYHQTHASAVKRSASIEGLSGRNCLWLRRLELAALCLLLWCSHPMLGLALCGPPRITDEPKSQILLAGDTASFSVGVLDEGPGCTPSYAWRYFDVPILPSTNPSATTPNLILTNVSSKRVGCFSVMVTVASVSVTSSPAYLTVVTGPQPSSQSVRPGASVTFTIQVDSGKPTDPFFYQWRFNSNELAGATSQTLTLSNVQCSQAGGYAVTVSNPAGSVTTSNALLIVEAEPRLGTPWWGADGLHFELIGCGSAAYVIQASKDFMDWTDISTNTVPSNGSVEFIDPDVFNLEARFYRAFRQP